MSPPPRVLHVPFERCCYAAFCFVYALPGFQAKGTATSGRPRRRGSHRDRRADRTRQSSRSDRPRGCRSSAGLRQRAVRFGQSDLRRVERRTGPDNRRDRPGLRRLGRFGQSDLRRVERRTGRQRHGLGLRHRTGLGRQSVRRPGPASGSPSCPANLQYPTCPCAGGGPDSETHSPPLDFLDGEVPLCRVLLFPSPHALPAERDGSGWPPSSREQPR